MSLVLDTSVLLGFLFNDEYTPELAALGDRVLSGGATAPALMRSEFANAVLMAERRQRLTAAHVSLTLRRFDDAGIVLAPPPDADQIRAIYDLAKAQELTVYDASYLELALQTGLPLATRDNRLAAAARSLGVEVLP